MKNSRIKNTLKIAERVREMAKNKIEKIGKKRKKLTGAKSNTSNDNGKEKQLFYGFNKLILALK